MGQPDESGLLKVSLSSYAEVRRPAVEIVNSLLSSA